MSHDEIYAKVMALVNYGFPNKCTTSQEGMDLVRGHFLWVGKWLMHRVNYDAGGPVEDPYTGAADRVRFDHFQYDGSYHEWLLTETCWWFSAKKGWQKREPDPALISAIVVAYDAMQSGLPVTDAELYERSLP